MRHTAIRRVVARNSLGVIDQTPVLAGHVA